MYILRGGSLFWGGEGEGWRGKGVRLVKAVGAEEGAEVGVWAWLRMMADRCVLLGF